MVFLVYLNETMEISILNFPNWDPISRKPNQRLPVHSPHVSHYTFCTCRFCAGKKTISTKRLASGLNFASDSVVDMYDFGLTWSISLFWVIDFLYSWIWLKFLEQVKTTLPVLVVKNGDFFESHGIPIRKKSPQILNSTWESPKDPISSPAHRTEKNGFLEPKCAMVKVVAFYWRWELIQPLMTGILIMGPYKPLRNWVELTIPYWK